MAKRKKIDDIVILTANELSYPPSVVDHLVRYYFAKVKEMMVNGDGAMYRMMQLGAFQAKVKPIYLEIEAVIARIRRTRKQTDIDKLRALLKLRHKAYDYSKSRKYKERFGSWHYKAVGGQDPDQNVES